MFDKLSLHIKLILACLAASMFLTATGVYQLLGMQQVHDDFAELTRSHAIVTSEKGEQLRTDIDHQSQTLVWVIALAAAAPLLLALCLGVWVTHIVSRSLTELRRGAQRVANGDFSKQIPVTVRDEVGEISLAFNEMGTRMRESYRRLALETQRDEAILASMGEGLLTADAKGRITIINRAAADLLGFASAEEAIGKSLVHAYQIYEAKGKKQHLLRADQRPAMRAIKTGKLHTGVYIYKASNGDDMQLNISASPVIVDDKVTGVVTVLRDVTKEKEIDRMKTEFISLASHQLRTPLSAIKWFSEMLVSGDAGKLKAEQQDFAKNIVDSTGRMIALVNALLNISRIESGRIMINPLPTDLRELVGGITNDLKGKTEEKKQTLIISVHEGLPKINLDPRLVSQVYLNLLTNAIKYTPKGGEISVFISKKGDDVISQVTDNGYGIPKEQQDRVFQKFFRAANAVKVETDGTGLGLYLIKAIIESSGGKIWFESAEGKGTTFWFSIPLSGMKAKEGEVTLDA